MTLNTKLFSFSVTGAYEATRTTEPPQQPTTPETITVEPVTVFKATTGW